MLLALLTATSLGSTAWACTVTLDSPAAGELVSENPEFAWTTDCVVTRVGFRVPGSGSWDWKPWGPWVTFTNQQMAWRMLSQGPWVDGVRWRVQGRAADGSRVNSAIRMLDVNVPPSVPAIAIAPSDPVAEIDDLVCEVSTPATDLDGDAVTYSFTWTVDGARYPRAADTGATTTTWTGDTIPAADLAIDETWACLVRADDGHTTSSRVRTTLKVEKEPVPDFSLTDENPNSGTYGQAVSPRDYLEVASGWYFGHAT